MAYFNGRNVTFAPRMTVVNTSTADLQAQIATLGTVNAELISAGEGVLFNASSDTDVSPSKEVPANAMPFARLELLGGLSFVFDGEIIDGAIDVVTSTLGLTEYHVPAAVQALDGYGKGISASLYNYVDFSAKKFVKAVGRIDLGTLTWTKVSGRYFRSNGATDIKAGVDSVVSPLLMAGYTPATYTNVQTNTGTAKIVGVSSGKYIGIYDSEKASLSAAQFKAAMDGVYLYYELATPVETNVSDYIITPPYIETESGDNVYVVGDGNTDVPWTLTCFITI